MNRLRRCKIVATLGPASNDEAAIENLWRAGADLFRINMSHADPVAMRERVAMIRAVEERVGRPIGVLVDLQGPKLRVGVFAGGGARSRRRTEIRLRFRHHARRRHPGLPAPSGNSRKLAARSCSADRRRAPAPACRRGLAERAVATVEFAGRISNRKGVSLPDTEIPFAAMTAKDRVDLEAAVETGVDWIALSFVQRAEEVAEVKKIAAGRALILAKIEKPQAIIASGGDHEGRRRADGGARRSRRGNAAGESAGLAKTHHPRGAPLWPSGDRGDADARIDDHRAGADPRRSVGCRHGGFRGRRRHHALGGKRFRRLPIRRWR